jgi:hypothetical protein
MVKSFSEVIDRFNGPAAFGHAVGMKPNAAKQARRRNSIAPARFPDVARAAQERGLHDITVDRLFEIAAERRDAAA